MRAASGYCLANIFDTQAFALSYAGQEKLSHSNSVSSKNFTIRTLRQAQDERNEELILRQAQDERNEELILRQAQNERGVYS